MPFARRKTRSCQCLDESVLLETLVIVLTLVAAIAITGHTLIEFDVIIVPKDVEFPNSLSSHHGTYTNNTNGQSSHNTSFIDDTDGHSSQNTSLEDSTTEQYSQNATLVESTTEQYNQNTTLVDSTTEQYNQNTSLVESTTEQYSQNTTLVDSTTEQYSQNASQMGITVNTFTKITHEHVGQNKSSPVKGHKEHTYKEADEDLEDLLKRVLLYINIGITALFLIEIFLKLVTLRKKCLSNPGQLIDALVVVLCAAFQAVFKFISIPKIYYCCSYLIVLRLWRIYCVCYIKAKRMKDIMEKDIEHRITDHLQTRQRCIILENACLKQESRIKELESVYIKSKDGYSSYNNSNNNNNTYKGHSRKSSRNSSIQMNKNDRRQPTTRGSDVNGGREYMEISPKPRWRRSSTNEYLEHRLSLYSDHDTLSLSQRSTPNPGALSEHESNSASQSPTADYYDMTDGFDEVDGRTDNVSLSSLTDLDTSSSHGKVNENKKKSRFKRQNSCPEYMFTQRMKLTKVESMLIEEHRLSETTRGLDNDGFSPEDGIPMTLLGMRSSTMTYRSQDGIPTTDL